MGINFKKKYPNLVISKSQKKVTVAKEIGYVNDIVLSKIVQGNELR